MTNMLNIVVPMAGAGSRFLGSRYKVPKPLILINDVPMVKLVIENIRPKFEHRFIFICQRTHIEKYDLMSKLAEWSPGCNVIALNELTEGAALTVLSASDHIDNDTPLMIANSDQFIEIDIDTYLSDFQSKGLDGYIMTMKSSDPKWSYIGLNDNGLVDRVVEKEVISDNATVGIYNFKRGKDFVFAARRMVARNFRVNGEFYVAPCYNDLIKEGGTIGHYDIGKESCGMHGLGTPEDLDAFLRHPICAKATIVNS